MGILNFAVAYDAVLLPLAWDDFAWREDQRSFAKELIAQTIADVLIAIEKFEVSFNLNPILIHSSTSPNKYLKTTPLW